MTTARMTLKLRARLFGRELVPERVMAAQKATLSERWASFSDSQEVDAPCGGDVNERGR